jgi:hypothetical protein
VHFVAGQGQALRYRASLENNMIEMQWALRINTPPKLLHCCFYLPRQSPAPQGLLPALMAFLQQNTGMYIVIVYKEMPLMTT